MRKHAIYILIIAVLIATNVITLRSSRRWEQTAGEWQQKMQAQVELFQKLAMACTQTGTK